MAVQSLTSSKFRSAEGPTDTALALLRELASRGDDPVARMRPANERPASPPSAARMRTPLEPPPPALLPPPVSDSMRVAAIAGWAIIILFFGVLGGGR